jgi:hypothetical protein
MKDDLRITAEQILAGKSSTIPPDTQQGATIPTISAAEVVGAFRQRFDKGPDVGMWRRLSNTVVEPPNPFDAKSRRRIRHEAIILGALVFTAVALATYFNLHAPSR